MRQGIVIGVVIVVCGAAALCVTDPSALSAADFIPVCPSPFPKVICLTRESDADMPWSACRDTAVPSGFRVPWTWNSSQAQLPIVSDGRFFGEVPLFTAGICDEDPVCPILTAIETPHFCSNRNTANRIDERHLPIGREPELLPLEWFCEDRGVVPRTDSRPCCWVTVPNLAIDENSTRVIKVSANTFVAAGRIYSQTGFDGWYDGGMGYDVAFELNLLIIDSDDVVSVCDVIPPAPIVVAAERLEPGGFVSFVAVTRQGEYRMGMISPAGILSPTRAVTVKEAYRESVESYVAKRLHDSGASVGTIQPAAATILDRAVQTPEAEQPRDLSGAFGKTPDFVEGLTVPVVLPLILPDAAGSAD